MFAAPRPPIYKADGHRPFSNMPPFGLQKTAFCLAICGLLAAKRPSFASQKATP